MWNKSINILGNKYKKSASTLNLTFFAACSRPYQPGAGQALSWAAVWAAYGWTPSSPSSPSCACWACGSARSAPWWWWPHTARPATWWRVGTCRAEAGRETWRGWSRRWAGRTWSGREGWWCRGLSSPLSQLGGRTPALTGRRCPHRVLWGWRCRRGFSVSTWCWRRYLKPNGTKSNWVLANLICEHLI